MGDRYIDYREVSEYGRHFWVEAAKLVGVSTLVDIEALRQLVLAEVEALEARLAQMRVQQSGVRTGRSSTYEAAADVCDWLRRFYHFLKTIPANTAVDHAAFFPSGNLDKLERLKPADLLARSQAVLSGFTAPVNATLPGAATWQASIAGARDALQAALSGKQGASSDTTDAVHSLAEARLRFLVVYNDIAKRLVHAVLAQIGRLDEYRRYFLDLQVNEDGSRVPAEPALPGQPDTAPVEPDASAA